MDENQLETRKSLIERIFWVKNEADFERTAIAVFKYQVRYNEIYKRYISTLRVKPEEITTYEKIPFLPIEIYKHQRVVSFHDEPCLIFKSSGTTNTVRSSLYVLDPEIYHQSLLKSFEYFYGSPSEYIFLALLPNYLEQGDSSLVYMVKRLMEYSGQSDQGFYLNNYSDLYKKLKAGGNNSKTIFLIGVSYALILFAAQFSCDLKDSIVMETGGMKGKIKEMIREELHEKLKLAFNIPVVHSEYGMTELLSQAYSKGKGFFHAPPWMKIMIRDIYDPLTILNDNIQGVINIIDLANVDSCSFIASQDLGIKTGKTFQILGRIDNSDIRGCNLLLS